MSTRRSLLRTSLLLSAGAAAGRVLRGLSQNAAPASIRIESGAPLCSVPPNFIGLGYEMLSAAQLGLLSAQNTKYVQSVRSLGRAGVLRFGGIVSDYTRYIADGAVRADPKDTVVTRASLEQLRGFLDATGWTAIWSVNFGAGTLDQAIAEARDVQRILGPRLEAIELGNEVENYGKGGHPLRKPPYDFSQYLAQYQEWHHKMLATVPGLRFAAPDTAGSVEWVEQMAADAHGEVQLLTTHFYLGSQQKGTLAQMTDPNPGLKDKLERLRQASRSSGMPWRMCETNSFFGGGRPGLSDTFAGALWTLDYLLLLAQYGCAGVNLETGVNQLGFMSSYSPIVADDGRVEVGAPYYGMLAFAAAGAAGAGMLSVKLAGATPDLRAYAIGKRGRVRALVILNWSESQQAEVSLREVELHSPTMLRLTAPSLGSKTGVAFGGAQVDTDGKWKPAAAERIRGAQIVIPPASAAVLLAGAVDSGRTTS